MYAGTPQRTSAFAREAVHHLPVEQVHLAAGVLGVARFVGDHADGRPFGVQARETAHAKRRDTVRTRINRTATRGCEQANHRNASHEVGPTVLRAASSLVRSRTAWAIVLVAMNSVKNTAPGDGSQHRATFPSWFAMPCSPLRTPRRRSALSCRPTGWRLSPSPPWPVRLTDECPHRGSRRPRAVDGCPPAGRGGRHRARPWRTGHVAPRVQPRTLPRDRPAHRRAAAMILPAEVSPGGNSRALTAATAPFRLQTNP